MNRALLITGDTGFIGMNYLRNMVDNVPDNELPSFVVGIHLAASMDPVTGYNMKDYVVLMERLKKRGVKVAWSSGNLAAWASISPCPSNKVVSWVRELPDNCGIDVLNFASQSHVDNAIEKPYELFCSNNCIIMGVVRLVRAITEARSHAQSIPTIYHISTDEVYGANTTGTPTPISGDFCPANPYAASKAAQEHFLRSIEQTYGSIKVVVMRLSNQFGPYQYTEKMIPHSVAEVVKGNPIRLYGGGYQHRQWSYCPTTVQIIAQMMKAVQAGAYQEPILHIADSSNNAFLSNEQLIRRYLVPMLVDCGFAPEVYYSSDRPGHDFAYRLDSMFDYSCPTMGTITTVPFTKAMNETIQWCVDRLKR